MASPQVENGYVAIAHDLFKAIGAADLKAIEKDIILAVIYFTYGKGQKKAEIGNDDIQIFLSGNRRVRADRVEEAIQSLLADGILFSQEIGEGRRLLGVQKDYDKWFLPGEVDKLSTIVSKDTSVLLDKPLVRSTMSDKLSTLVAYAHNDAQHQLPLTAYKVELKHARIVYQAALELTLSPQEATWAIQDYLDELKAQDWFKNCRMRFVFLHSRFRGWYKSRPKKPRDVRLEEEAIGRRYIYNQKIKRWEPKQ